MSSQSDQGQVQGPGQARPQLAPQAVLVSMAQEYMHARCLHIAAELGIADVVGDGERSVDEIAKAVGTNADATFRLMRALATRGLWEETTPRHFKLTPLGAVLRKDAPGSMRDFVLYIGNADYVKIWNNAREAIETSKPVSEKVLGMPPFEHLKTHPEFEQTFSRAMTAMSTQSTEAIIGAYDFGAAGTMLDVGGGHGFTLAQILKSQPAMKGAVLDLPVVAPGARKLFGEQGVSDRATVIEGNFFETIPSGYDTYFMKSVVHDFDDEHARKILQNVRKAIGSKGRLLVADFVVPPGNAPHPSKWVDLHMLVMLGGRERSEKDFATLFESAGFALERIITTRSPTCLVEGRPI